MAAANTKHWCMPAGFVYKFKQPRCTYLLTCIAEIHISCANLESYVVNVHIYLNDSKSATDQHSRMEKHWFKGNLVLGAILTYFEQLSVLLPCFSIWQVGKLAVHTGYLNSSICCAHVLWTVWTGSDFTKVFHNSNIVHTGNETSCITAAGTCDTRRITRSPSQY